MAGLGAGDNVDNKTGHATYQLTYTLQWQGDDVAGGSHGVRFRPSSESVSCRHKIRDRRQTRWGRSGAGVQPVFGIPRWDIFSAAGSADHAKAAAGQAGRQTFALTRQPLNPHSANGRPGPASRGRPAHSATDLVPMRKPQPPVAGVNGRSVNRPFRCVALG